MIRDYEILVPETEEFDDLIEKLKEDLVFHPGDIDGLDPHEGYHGISIRIAPTKDLVDILKSVRKTEFRLSSIHTRRQFDNNTIGHRIFLERSD